MLLEELRIQVVEYGLDMLRSGLTMHTGGNLSARDPDSGLIAIKPSSRPYWAMKPEDVAVIDLSGQMVDGRYPPSSEWPMHTMLYQAYPQAHGVVHCHSIYASAAAAAGVELPLICHELCVYCDKPVRVSPFAVPGTEELGQSALKGLGADNRVALLKNHGTVAIGATLWHAYDAACAAELAAHILAAAKSFGAPAEVPREGRLALRKRDPMRRTAE